MTLLEGLKIHNHEAAPYVILGGYPLHPSYFYCLPHGLSLLPKSEEPHLYEARNTRRVQHGGPRPRFCGRCQAWKVSRVQHERPRLRFLRRKQARSLSRAPQPLPLLHLVTPCTPFCSGKFPTSRDAEARCSYANSTSSSMNPNVTVDTAVITDHEVHNQLKNIAKFFCDYASTLLSSGATTMRIQRKVKQMAEAWDVEAIFTIMPANVLFTLWDKDGEHSYTCISPLAHAGINFDTITRLSRLSDEVFTEDVTLAEANEKLQEIKKDTPSQQLDRTPPCCCCQCRFLPLV